MAMSNNWRIHKYASLTILSIAVLTLLFGFNLLSLVGIDSLADKVFNTFTGYQIIGAGLAYVMYAFYELIRA